MNGMTFSPDSDPDVETRARVLALLETIQWKPVQKKFRTIEVVLHHPLLAPAPVARVHKIWNEDFLAEVKSPPGLPRLGEEVMCPAGTRLVEVSYISRMSGGMGSYHQFDGYFLSIILSQDARSFLDVRGEVAY